MFVTYAELMGKTGTGGLFLIDWAVHSGQIFLGNETRLTARCASPSYPGVSILHSHSEP
jgi:hypothetical protein